VALWSAGVLLAAAFWSAELLVAALWSAVVLLAALWSAEVLPAAAALWSGVVLPLAAALWSGGVVVVVVVVVVDCALWSAGGVEPAAGAADCDEAALLELASGEVPGALVAGCEPAADWSLCGMELEGCELEAEVSLLLGVVLEPAEALWAFWSEVLPVVLGEFAELEAAAGALPMLSLEDEEAAPELLLALSHLSETMFTLSTLNLFCPLAELAEPLLAALLPDWSPDSGWPVIATVWPTWAFRSWPCASSVQVLPLWSVTVKLLSEPLRQPWILFELWPAGWLDVDDWSGELVCAAAKLKANSRIDVP
jgi:hypothetical protein